jgi:hypothetical protein
VQTPPPPPWTLSLEGLVWLHRAVPEAARFHQPGLRFDRGIPVTVGGFARYVDSPVGAYSEVWGSPTLVVRRRSVSLAVPFMAVDSAASLRGGRANWALPKVPAAFGPDRWAASGDGWSLLARVLSAGPRIPLLATGHLLQAREDGALLRSRCIARGAGRPARVLVDGEPPAWLAPGRHLGLVVDRATLVVRAPG